MMNGKDLEGSGRGLILRNNPSMSPKGLRKTTKNPSQGSRSPGRYLNPGPPKYEAGLLTTYHDVRWLRDIASFEFELARVR
jgi:hypothetical protein